MNYTIIPAEAHHLPEVVAIRKMDGVMENMLSVPSERPVKLEASWSTYNPDIHNFVALDENEKVVGWAGLFISTNLRQRHSAGIGICVHSNHQHHGVGRELMHTLLDLADNWLMLKRVELTVFTENELAISFYKKLGFEIEGTMRAAAIRNGNYQDEHMMARINLD